MVPLLASSGKAESTLGAVVTTWPSLPMPALPLHFFERAPAVFDKGLSVIFNVKKRIGKTPDDVLTGRQSNGADE